MLEGVGLGETEERVYRVLLRQPSVTARELSEQLEMSVVLVRRSADRLVVAGLASAHEGTPARYAPVDPRLGLTALVHSRQADLQRASSAVPTYAAEYHERMLQAEPHRLVEMLDGPSAITERLEGLLRAAEHEVVAFDAPPYVTVEPNATPGEQELLGRGVRVRAVYASGVLDVPGRAENIRELARLGEHSRVVPHVPLKMVVVDKRVAVIPLTDREESTRTTAVVVRRSRLCDALVELFEATWSQGTPLFPAPGTEVEGELSDVDREILALLGAGLKDESVARHLGLSERTVRRRISDLVTRLGATSRFQAGAQAARRGWV